MKPKRPKAVLIHEPTLFELDKLEQPANLASKFSVERPYSEPGLLLGTSAFTANGWSGSFYPPGMQLRDFLSYYAAKFETVEIDTLTPQAVPLRPSSLTCLPSQPKMIVKWRTQRRSSARRSPTTA